MSRMDWLKEHYRHTRDADNPQSVLDRYRMGMKAGGSIQGIRVMVSPDGCPTCMSLAGVIYSLDLAPPLPNPNCTKAGGCHCTYRPVMTYDESGDARRFPDQTNEPVANPATNDDPARASGGPGETRLSEEGY